MSEYSYFFVKNTHSYDRAVAILKFLQADTHGFCRDSVMKFLAENFYIKYDYALLNKLDPETAIQEALVEIKKNFFHYKQALFPNIRALIYNEKTFFYFLFSNLSFYDVQDFLTNHKVVNIQQIKTPNVEQIYNSFYLETCFFDSSNINIDLYGIQKYRPSIEFRAQQQIKIILQEQIIQKHHSISRTEVMKINNAEIESNHITLMNKVKSAIVKAESAIAIKKSNTLV